MDLDAYFGCEKNGCDCKIPAEDHSRSWSHTFIKVIDNNTGKRHKLCSDRVHKVPGGLDLLEENCEICDSCMYGEAFDSKNAKKAMCIACCGSLIEDLVARIKERHCLRYTLFEFKRKYINDCMISTFGCGCGIKHPCEEEGEPIFFISKKGDKIPLECEGVALGKICKMYYAKKKRYVHLRAIINAWKEDARTRYLEEAKARHKLRRAAERMGAKRVLRTYLAPCVTDTEIDDICRVKRAFGMKADQLDNLAEKVDFRRFMKWLNKFRNEYEDDEDDEEDE